MSSRRKRQLPDVGRSYDPPWRSVPQGRGLPRTPIIKAVVPVILLAAVVVLAVTFILAGISALQG
ncbi:MAG TPA: hypothetical protein VFE49_05845 [Jiangellaceae bacterium]|nr:hypothetical protein [Jiangellaceae bacterium]